MRLKGPLTILGMASTKGRGMVNDPIGIAMAKLDGLGLWGSFINLIPCLQNDISPYHENIMIRSVMLVPSRWMSLGSFLLCVNNSLMGEGVQQHCILLTA